jgi:hypothetical protein
MTVVTTSVLRESIEQTYCSIVVVDWGERRLSPLSLFTTNLSEISE